ncbi:hypothetical protein HDK90DRAFT_467144 [Phyllosticta capitalensis]|uniref:Phospholipase n=1 Tax=Phyllosticta capitalensis TaxID=121624 RepID=A0ABR1YJG3_9PEZI
MDARDDEDHLAYGDYHGDDQYDDGRERGLVRDLGRRLLHKNHHGPEASQTSKVGDSFQPVLIDHKYQPTHSYPYTDPSSANPQFSFDQPDKPPKMTGFFEKIKEAIVGEDHEEAPTQQEFAADAAETAHEGAQRYSKHRFMSFAPQRQSGNDAKWFVDACGYMWAVSVALERAQESIWILDWWLSPELYLRRPPAKNQNYRIDRMLQAAAERGVKVNIIVYKEVSQALTLSSEHTKHHLEALHPNIAVFRHPDHIPDANTVGQDLIDEFKNFSLSAKSAASLPVDALKAIYGSGQDTVLYWAHHEKLCLIDGSIAFMGGLDLCYGRWDTNQHSIADVHPGDLDEIVFPGQDYNNARIMDFQDVKNWQNNKLDREESSRMGWSDVALSLRGPIIEDLKEHFVQRWNFIYHEKYKIRSDERYSRLTKGSSAPTPAPEDDLAYEERQPGGFQKTLTNLSHRAQEGFEHGAERFGYHSRPRQDEEYGEPREERGDGSVGIQLARSCAKWSHGVTIEHSIQNAYIEIIKNSKHFVYIENQFFITATQDDQKAIKNKVGAAIVERIIRAAKNGENWKMVVLIPSVPAFPGDLRTDEAASTRAIMEFQYNSINRGHGKSIYECVAAEGINPMDYIRFYNLRNYDRINVSGALDDAEDRGGVSYEDAREEHDREYGGRYQRRVERDEEEDGYPGEPGEEERYDEYQEGARRIGKHKGLGSGRWDSVAECYMLGGEDIRNVPWENGSLDEIEAFVSEELYIHSKLLIADDRIVICGSANLNDRSQLGDHDSEIAVIIEDPTPVDSAMGGAPWRASKFAASLRRQLMRKHLGLLKPQDYTSPDDNYLPITDAHNTYDWGSAEDEFVTDPLSDDFQAAWNRQAKTNTDAFGEVFHAVPADNVHTWEQYDEYYERYFKDDGKDDEKDDDKPRRYKRGHVVAENFAPGDEGARQVKEILSRVRGMLVEMPLLFLKDEDVAEEGLSLNTFTETIYT